MRTIWQTFKSMRLGRNTLELLIWLLFGGAMYLLLEFVFVPTGPFAQYPGLALHIIIGIGMLLYMDRVHHSNIDTTKAINDKNTAYAQIILAYAIIIAAAISKV